MTDPIPKQTFLYDIDDPYVPERLRSNLLVPRNIYKRGSDGTRERVLDDNGDPAYIAEPGWTSLGEMMIDGVPHQWVERQQQDTQTGEPLFKANGDPLMLHKKVPSELMTKLNPGVFVSEQAESVAESRRDRAKPVMASVAFAQLPLESTPESQKMAGDNLKLKRFSKGTKELAKPLELNSSGERFIEAEPTDYAGYLKRLYALEDDDDEGMNVELAAIRQKKREVIKPENIRLALETLNVARTRDQQLGMIISRHRPKMAGATAVIDELRSNHELRCELVDYFKLKLDRIRSSHPGLLAERVRYDDGQNLKSPNSDGYSVDKMTSSEYVAMLALAKIDGSFDPGRADSIQSHTRADGSPGFGQHREAADEILQITR